MFRKLVRYQRGVGAIEYAFVASLISIAALAGYISLGEKVTSHYNTVDREISNAL